MKLSELTYKKEIWVPDLEVGDSVMKIDMSMKLRDYKKKFFNLYGEAEISFIGNKMNIHNEGFLFWKSDYMERKANFLDKLSWI
jgi:hypothetical protein